mmetsp:Transcript_37001/g.93307  ORF Transcript_37001/g.93307 Transcript_37001/m.93307 type:complete len:340 (+) Transcript_37001:643-1662(+)
MMRVLDVARQRSSSTRSLARSAWVSSTASESALEEPEGPASAPASAASPAAAPASPACTSSAATRSPRGTSPSGASSSSSSSSPSSMSSSSDASSAPRFLPAPGAAATAAVRMSAGAPMLSAPSTVTSSRVCLALALPAAAAPSAAGPSAVGAVLGSSTPPLAAARVMVAGLAPGAGRGTATCSKLGLAAVPRATVSTGPALPDWMRTAMTASPALPPAPLMETRASSAACTADPSLSPPLLLLLGVHRHTSASPPSDTPATSKAWCAGLLLPFAIPLLPAAAHTPRAEIGSWVVMLQAATCRPLFLLFLLLLAGVAEVEGAEVGHTATQRSPAAADTA